ncbi:hypothetical protein LLG95_06310 [bacterium]|nr:hypothetical protein [bacterium]
MMWKPSELGEIVAEREFIFRPRQGEAKKIVLRIGRPVKGPEADGPFWCPYQLDGLFNSEIQATAGEDSMQALCLTLEGANKLLMELAKKWNGKFEVFGSDKLPPIFNWHEE